MVEHADLFDQSQRVVERQQVDQGAEADPSSSLRRRYEEESRRRSHAERRAVVLREVVAEEACGIRFLQELQPVVVELMQRDLAPVDPIEHPERYLSHHSSSAASTSVARPMARTASATAARRFRRSVAASLGPACTGTWR